VLRHDDGRVQMEPAVIPAQAALQNDITAVGRKRDSGPLSKADKDRTVSFLDVRKPATICIRVSEHERCFTFSSFKEGESQKQGQVNMERMWKLRKENLSQISARAGMPALHVGFSRGTLPRGQECPRYTLAGHGCR